jgi:hypothetical protein
VTQDNVADMMPKVARGKYMQQIQLDDRLFKEAQQRAARAGFSTVEEYIADFLTRGVDEGAEALDYLFTPEVIAELDQISARVKAGGKTYSLDEVQEHFANKRKQWLQDHPA